jgi:hypothetical protein
METTMNDQTDRVRRHTAAEVLRRIDSVTVTSLSDCAASPAQADRRLKELDKEWDIDRALETEAAATGLIGLALGTFVRKQLFAVPAFVAAAVLLQATTGRYPLMPLLRRLGLRTSKEIARERYALKALRGDFDGMGMNRDAEAALSGNQPVDQRRLGHECPGLQQAHGMSFADRLPATACRVEMNTSPELNDAIRQRTDAEIVRLEGASAAEIDQRLRALEAEWDVERLLQTNASVIVLLGLTLAAGVNRKFLLLPAGVFSFFAQHALQGWCPPIPVFRRLGVRTQREIERERYALKALRGDFDQVPAKHAVPTSERVRAVLSAVDK